MISFVTYQILIDKQAQKFLKTLHEPEKSRIISKIYALTTDKLFLLDIKKLQGYENHYRIRIGEYRVVFVAISDQKILIVTIIEHRKIIYSLLRRKK